MVTIEALSLAMGTAWTSGINLYATVAALGIANQAQLIQLPPDLQVLSHPAVIAIACTMYVIEFFADKIPAVNHLNDVYSRTCRSDSRRSISWRRKSGLGTGSAACRRLVSAGRPWS